MLELRANGISMCNIESLMHISRYTISAINEVTDNNSISCDNVILIYFT